MKTIYTRRQRRSREPILLVSLLLLTVAAGCAGNIQPVAYARPGEEIRLAEDVEGTWKSHLQEAKADAVESARRVVADYLRAQNPPIEWVPTSEFVKKHLIKNEKTTSKNFPPDVGPMYQSLVRIEVGGKAYEEMALQGRHHRMEQRQVDLLKIFAGIIPLLVVLSVYFRLEEWSRGKASLHWLRLAAASCVAAVVGVGLWYLQLLP